MNRTNPYTVYLSFDKEGNVIFTPIIYKDDKVQIVSANSFGGAWFDEKFEYTYDNMSGNLPVSDTRSKLIKDILKK